MKLDLINPVNLVNLVDQVDWGRRGIDGGSTEGGDASDHHYARADHLGEYLSVDMGRGRKGS